MRTLVSFVLVVGVALAACKKQPRTGPPAPEPVRTPVPPEPTPPVVKPSVVETAPLGPLGLVVELRATQVVLAPGDPLLLALHLRGQTGPLEPRPEQTLNREAWVRSLEIVLVAPNGAPQASRVDVVAGKVDRPPAEMSIYYAPAMLLELDAEGVRDLVSNTAGLWRTPPGALTSEGIWRVSVRGEVAGQAFELPALSFERSRAVLAQDSLWARARDAVQAAAPDATVALGPGFPTESGFVPRVAVEREPGQLVFRFAEQPVHWSYKLWTVTLDRKGKQVSIDQRTVGTCVAAGTRVITRDGERAIETLVEGDVLLAVDPMSGARHWSTLLTIRPGRANRTLGFAGGLRVTTDHPVMVAGHPVAAAKLRADTPLDTLAGPRAAGHAQVIDEDVAVFDLTTTWPHTFVAGGVLVHNKDRNYRPELDDPWYFMWAE